MTYQEAKSTIDIYYDRIIGKPIALARIVYILISDEDNLSSVYKLVALNKINNKDALTSIGIFNNKNLNVFLFGSQQSIQGFSTLNNYLSRNSV